MGKYKKNILCHKFMYQFYETMPIFQDSIFARVYANIFAGGTLQ